MLDRNEITKWTLTSYSHAIMCYLVEQYAKDDSLYPKDPKKRALVNHKLYFDTTTLYQRFINYYVSKMKVLFKVYCSAFPVSIYLSEKL
jgi:hypothetical protein